MSAFANMANVCRTYMDALESGEREGGGLITETLDVNVLEMLQG